MNDFNYEEWLSIVRNSYLKIKSEIQELYNVKDTLDQEISTLFVEKVTTFYYQFNTLCDSQSVEGEKTELTTILFSSNLEKLIQAYSDILRFKSVIEDLTGKTVQYPEVFQEVWVDLKKKYLDDFIYLKDTSKLEVLARFKNKDLLDSAMALDSIFKNSVQNKYYIYNAPYLYQLYRSLKQLEDLVIEDLVNKEYGSEIE